MPYALGQRSLDRLKGVHPDLVEVIQRAISLTPQDFTILEGVRSKARQLELYAQGRTQPGPVVTWTKTSNHFVRADGFGYAVDMAPFPIDWNDAKRFDDVAQAMFKAAELISRERKAKGLKPVEIRWGADWDQDGKPRERGESDSPHFELVA